MGFGDVGLWEEGGVGKVAEGAGVDILASKGAAFGPSKCIWASVKHADAMIREGNKIQSGVLYLRGGQIGVTLQSDLPQNFRA